MKFAGILPILFVSMQVLAAQASGQETQPREAQSKDGPACGQEDKRPECARKAPRPSRYSPPVTVDLVPSPPLPRTSSPPSPPAPATTNGTARAPAAVNNCDAGGCWGAGGNRYHGGTGDVYLDNGGRQCRRVGTWMQCN